MTSPVPSPPLTHLSSDCFLCSETENCSTDEAAYSRVHKWVRTRCSQNGFSRKTEVGSLPSSSHRAGRAVSDFSNARRGSSPAPRLPSPKLNRPQQPRGDDAASAPRNSLSSCKPEHRSSLGGPGRRPPCRLGPALPRLPGPRPLTPSWTPGNREKKHTQGDHRRPGWPCCEF